MEHDGPERIAHVRAATVRGRGVREGDLAVPIEAPLAIQANEEVVAHLMRLPGDDVELALGFCLTEGLIGGMGDVLGVEVCDAAEGKVTVRTSRELLRRRPVLLTSACVGPRDAGGLDLPEPLAPGGLVVSSEALVGLPAAMQAAQKTRRAAGAVHAAAVFRPSGEPVVLREDVGRHNAIDKVVGHCLHQGHALSECLLVTTGRASSEMVLKAVAARLPLVASRSGPTSLGVELAERLGVTLVGYLRPSSLTVYAHPERIAREHV